MRPLPLLLAAALVAGPACSDGVPASDGPLRVAAAFYPLAFLAERVGGDDVEVTTLAGPGVEPHDLELTPGQRQEVEDADLVIHLRGFQPAVDDALDGVPALDAATVMPLDRGDLHVWVDPLRFDRIAGALADRLIALRPAAATGIRQRRDDLQNALRQLDTALGALATCPRRDVVTTHGAFGYLARFGLRVTSVAGGSPEDEPSPKRLREVATLIRERGVTTVHYDEPDAQDVARTLAGETGARVAELNPVELRPAAGDYLSAMAANVATLRSALGCA